MNTLYQRLNWTTKQPVKCETYSQSAKPAPSAESMNPEVKTNTLIDEIDRDVTPISISTSNSAPNTQLS